MEHFSLEFKKGDFLAIGIVFFLVILISLFRLPMIQQSSGFAHIYLDGKLIREAALSVDQTFQVHGDYTNTVTIRDGKIAVTHTDCPTGDCLRQGWIFSVGTIVCLPNRMEIRLTDNSDVDILI